MSLSKSFFSFALLVGICLIFFYKILLGQVPFPGDLLVNIEPFKSQGFLGYAAGGFPHKAQGPDVIYEIYPWKYFTIGELKKGHIPFWNPYNFSGNPMMQDFQSAVFYPLNALYFLFDFNTAWTLFILSQPVLASIFMFIFLRDLKLSKETSIISGVAFAFSSYMAVWMEYGNIGSVFSWLPLLLFLVRRILMESGIRYVLWGIFVLTLAFLGGYIQGVFYLYIVLFAYSIFLLVTMKKITKSKIIHFILFLILPIFLSAYQLLPTIELFKHSTRIAFSLSQIESMLQPMLYWISIAVPDFFGHPASRNYYLNYTYIERVMSFGVPFILFVMIALLRVGDKTKTFFFVLGLSILLFTTNLPLVKYFYLIPIPMISTTVPTRILSLFIFCMIVVGSYGLEYLFKEKRQVNTRIILAYISIYIILWCAVFILPFFIPRLHDSMQIARHNMIIPTVLALATIALVSLRKHRHEFFFLGILFVVSIELFLGFHKITPFSRRELIYPSTPVVSFLQRNSGINRFWGYGQAYIPSNFQSVDHTYSPEGNDPLHIRDYGILTASSNDGKYPVSLPRPDANIAPGYGQEDMRRNQFRQKILNLLGVEFILNKKSADFDQPDGTFPDNIYKLIWHDHQWQVYQNTQALPRFFMAYDYVVIPDQKKQIAAVYSSLDLAKTLILDHQPIINIDKNSHGQAELLAYEPMHTSFKTETNGNALLFLSDTYYQSWIATIDGREVPIIKADVAFRAVAVPKGKHTVQFIYNPKTFNNGLYIAIVGVVILIMFAVLKNRKYI